MFSDSEARSVRIVLVDRADDEPIFSNEPATPRLRALVPMWVRPYTTLLTLKSVDAQLGAQVTYQIESGAWASTVVLFVGSGSV